MAHSPIEQSRLARDPQLVEFARAIDMTRAQVALAWPPLRHSDVIAIPKISQREHLRETVSALDIELTSRQLKELNRHFLAPNKPDALEMLRKPRCSRLRNLPNDKPKRIWQRKGHGDDGGVRSAEAWEGYAVGHARSAVLFSPDGGDRLVKANRR